MLLRVCLSVTRVDQSKTVEVGIMQRSPQISTIIIVHGRQCDLHSYDLLQTGLE